MNKLSAYSSFFGEIIDTINSARYQAFKSLNKFHIGQNFEIGRIIVENQDKNQRRQMIDFRHRINQNQHDHNWGKLYMMLDLAQKIRKPERRDKADCQNNQ